ncbi:YbaB/EbfC family nucleoid-associated protein [Nocardia sp. A7]|uniref:YbaB/EbfC family nucleoid-associated protein n=1 Tax=Nocardia sp. A7 TaxID=2789274 RepID=UPI00397C7858
MTGPGGPSLPPHLAGYANSPGALAEALMDELVATAQRRVDRMHALGEQLAAIRVRESSPDGVVTVTVDGNGALLDLVLTSAVQRWTPEQFDTAVVDTVRRATAVAYARFGDLVTEFNSSPDAKVLDSQQNS